MPLALLGEWYQVCLSKGLQPLNRGAIIWNYWKFCSLKLFEPKSENLCETSSESGAIMRV